MIKTCLTCKYENKNKQQTNSYAYCDAYKRFISFTEYRNMATKGCSRWIHY